MTLLGAFLAPFHTVKKINNKIGTEFQRFTSLIAGIQVRLGPEGAPIRIGFW